MSGDAGADDLDIAAELQEIFNRKGIQAAQDKAAPERHPDFDGKTCLDCAEDVHVERLTLGKIRCIVCQTKLEHRLKIYRR